jgi:parallel beta helix pectate lyase-like protein
MSKQLATGAGVTVGATLLMGGVAQAACTCVVENLEEPTDAGTTTLRQAIQSSQEPANSGSTITFASGLSGTITLSSALPTIVQPTTIAGPGAGQITIDGNDAYRPFTIDTSAGEDVSISGLTIAHGASAGLGGGIYSLGADFTLDHAVVTDNDSGSAPGGGVAAALGSLTIESSTITGNTTGERGGGVYTPNGTGTPATVRNSTIAGNSGVRYGGGLYFEYTAPATLENSTVYGNTAANGGGVYHYGAPVGPGLTVTGSTITHNTASRGGGLASFGHPGFAEPVVRNTIISGNSAGQGADLSSSRFDPGSLDVGFSLIGGVDPETTINQTGPNILGQDPQLGPLADNGGPTQTQKPAIASPVIDQGAAFGLGSDQRGLGRPVEIPTIPNAAGGDGSDIGAVELQPSELPSNTFKARVKGKKILVTVSVAGSVGVADAKAPLSATVAKKKKKKRKLFLKASSGTGGPPTITVALRLTKLAKQKLRQKGKLALGSRITFTPNRGIPSTKSVKLKIKGKKRKK